MGGKAAFWFGFALMMFVLWAIFVLPHMFPLHLHW
jgi:hypothetical protein